MSGLVEFLLARIAEDEAIAASKKGTGFFHFDREPNERSGGQIGYWLSDWQGSAFIDVTEHIARHDPARVLAECEAKRRIIERAVYVEQGSSDTSDIASMRHVLECLAQPYRDHPDFKPEWVI